MHFELKTKQQNTPEYTTLKHNLRVFNTILKKSIREAKSLYYEAVFLEYKHDMKNTWKVISGILNKSNKKKSPIRQIFIDGKKTDDMKKIANGFNSFFVNIGPNLAKIIDTSNKKVFTSYLTKSITSSFNFSLINEEDTLKIISSLKTKHSSGHDGISVKLLKALAPSIVRPLTIILNQSLTTGIFPDLLKTAKVIPLFKKEDAEIVDNYRPVSLLCAISKVFEKVAYNQIYDYFNDNKLFLKVNMVLENKTLQNSPLLNLLIALSLTLKKRKIPSLFTWISPKLLTR